MMYNVQTLTSTASLMLYSSTLFNPSISTVQNNTFQPKKGLEMNEIPIWYPIST